MTFPAFFDAIPPIRLHDPLAQFLGASDNGVIEYRYHDAVKLAGHSCPTVASAYWLTHLGLNALYGDGLPERGATRVELRSDRLAGVTGVIANVLSLLTGATQDTGFKGLGGRFDRRNLLYFNAPIPLEIRLTRTDNRAAVDLAADLRRLPAHAEMQPLMQRSLSGQATFAEERQFAALWQDRVRRLLVDHGDDPEMFVVRLADRTAAGAATISA